MEAGKRAPHTQTPPRSATGQVPAFHLAALLQVRRWSRWSRLYGVWVPGAAQPSRWLLRTIWLGYAIQFARRPPKFRGIHLTAVKAADAHDLWEESLSYWRRTWWYRSLQPIWRQGFSALTSLCPRKAVGYDQSWVCASWTGPFISLLSRCSCRTASSDASVPKFGLQHWPEDPVLPCVDPSVPQAIPAVCVRRTSISVQVLPFGLSLSPRVFTKVLEAALVPLREQGVRILNYLDDWFILAQSQDQLCKHRDWCSHTTASWAFGSTGKRANSCRCRGSLFSVWSWIRSIRQCASRRNVLSRCWTAWIRSRTGRMAAAAAVTPLGLLHMRPLQHWLHGRVPRWAWQSGTLRVQVTPACRQTFTPWLDLSFLRAGVPLEQVSRHAVVYTDASAKGWGATFNGLAVSGVWTGPQTALAYQLPRVAGSTPGLEPSQETLTRRARTGPYGQHCDRCVHQPTRWSTLPSHVATRPPPPPLESEASEVASRHSYSGFAQPDSRWAVTSCAPRRMETPSPDGPADLRRFGLTQIDLFASLETSHCQLFYSLTEGTLGTDALAHSWPQGLRKYAFPLVSLLAQTLCKVREEEEQILLVAPYWPTRTWFPELMLLVTAPPWQIPLRKDLLTQRRGTLWHPRPDLWKLHVWSLDGTRRF